VPTLPPEPTSTPVPTSTPEPTFTAKPVSTSAFATSEEYVTAAWKAYDNQQYEEAISFAQECIDKWENNAIEQQSKLTQAPPTGAVSEDEKKAIFANWALNDVGTSYFIKAQALQKLGKIAEARDAYNKAISFPYARSWDPKGWFWSPAEAAKSQMP